VQDRTHLAPHPATPMPSAGTPLSQSLRKTTPNANCGHPSPRSLHVPPRNALGPLIPHSKALSKKKNFDGAVLFYSPG
jgi:hypothetical protein